MGSRVMHLIIAERLANYFSLDNRKAFLLGGIAPDAVYPKERTYFYCGDHSEYTRSIDYEGFLRKYEVHRDSSYILGYYAHLVADDLWLKGFFMPWLKNRMEEDPTLQARYHHDFYLLNGKLAEHYNLRDDPFSQLPKQEDLIAIEELSFEAIWGLVADLQGDLNYNKSSLEETLQVFTLEQIVGYIETSVEKGIWHIRRFLG